MRGSFLLETVVAVSVLAITSLTLLPMVSQVANLIDTSKQYAKLVIISDYVGQYLLRWAEIPDNQKPLPFSYYMATEGKEFDITGDNRVNSMPWTQKLMSEQEFITDEYKFSATFHQTDSRTRSAVVKILVWYDKNNDGIKQSSEKNVEFSTVLSAAQ